MININSSLIAEMRDKPYRDAYVSSQIRMTLPIQIRELRKSKDITQPELADRAGMAQPRISELEKPGERRMSLETLLRLASAFDVGLQVRFVPFGELIDWSEGTELDGFDVPTFDEEIAAAEREQELLSSAHGRSPQRIHLVPLRAESGMAGRTFAEANMPMESINFVKAAQSGVENEIRRNPAV